MSPRRIAWRVSDIWDERQPEFNFRGRWRVKDEDGAYEFQTMLPQPYTVPNDGPVGRGACLRRGVAT